MHPKLQHPSFLNPTFSRLRSFVPKDPPSSNESPASSVTAPNIHFDASSHFSSISRSSSLTNIPETGSQGGSSNADTMHARPRTKLKREPFRWTALKNILIHVRTPPNATPQKAAKVLGGFLSTETPTVMAANGLVCVGTTQGRVHIFDFKQQLRSTCSGESIYLSILNEILFINDLSSAKQKSSLRRCSFAGPHVHCSRSY